MAASVSYESLLVQYKEYVSALTQDLLIHQALLKETQKRVTELEEENKSLREED
jgi:uncharacterized membrane protein (DUF106 family)